MHVNVTATEGYRLFVDCAKALIKFLLPDILRAVDASRAISSATRSYASCSILGDKVFPLEDKPVLAEEGHADRAFAEATPKCGLPLRRSPQACGAKAPRAE
eukprot:10491958-Prorocentrum_lima.AAC.1